MSGVITRDKITINSPYKLKKIYWIKLETKLNSHANLKIKANLDYESTDELESFLDETKTGDEIEFFAEDDGNQELLFKGILHDSAIQMVKGVGYVELTFYSGTWGMDIKKVSKSFQYSQMTYDALIDFTRKPYAGSDHINTAAKGTPIGRPILQYKETDWEFLKRVATHESTVLVPDITSPKARFWFGIPEPNKNITVDKESGDILINAQKYEDKQNISCYYYSVELEESLRIGDSVNINGDKLTVTEAEMIFADGLLKRRYKVENANYIKPKLYYNDTIKGLSLEGSIIDVRTNQVKIHLDIDEKQAVSEARWYPFAGEGNNVWYNMPHIGERIFLNYTKIDETAIAVTGTRGREGEMATTKSMSMPTEKYMQTKWGKTMALHEGDIEFDMATINVKMDEESVFVTSNDKITLEAAFDINIGKTEGIEQTLETKNISMIAEDLVTFKVMGTRSTVEMDVDNSIFSLMQTRMDGSNKAPMALLSYVGPEEQEPPPPPPPPPPPEPEKPKKSGFWNTVAKVALCAVAVAAVAVVCVVCAPLAVAAVGAIAAGTATAGVVAAGVLGTVAMGAAAYTGGKAVAEIAMTDDVGQYARDTIDSVVKGRFTDKHTALGDLLTMTLYIVAPELALAGTGRDLTCDIINLEDTPWYVTALDALGFGLSAFGVYSKYKPTKPISETAVKPAGEAQQKPNASAAEGSGDDVVTYRRVQGGEGANPNQSSQPRVTVNEDGSISIPNKSSDLNVSIDNGEHSSYFNEFKRGGTGEIVEFEVPKWFDDFLQGNAISQDFYKTNPLNQGGTAPKIVDPNMPGNSFELPAPWAEWIEEYARNARIIFP